MANKITVISAGNKVNVSTNPDMSMFYTERSREWAISDKIVNNEDFSSKYYANVSKEQAQISADKTTEVVNSANEALSKIDNAKTGALTDIGNLHSESIESITDLKNTTLSDIDTTKANAISDITNQETLSVENINTSGSTQLTNINNTGATQVHNVNTAGTTQVNLVKEQVALVTSQANIAKEKANIATTQANIAIAKTLDVVESGNNALSNIAAAKNNALDEINVTVDNAEQYAQNALNSANNAATSENNALLYKNYALENSQIATTQANIATSKANEATTSAASARTSETNAKSSENRCEEILTRLGTSIKIKGRVESFGDLPSSGNLDGDTYLVGEEGLSSYPEYYWYLDHWEFMGTTTSLVWGSITGDISAQTDLTNKLNSKQDVGNYALKSEIPTNNNQLTNGAGYITSSYHDSTKQNVITDLAIIKAGASKGAAALQPGDNISKLTNDAGYTTNIGTITGITMNGASKGTSGVINLGTVITAHQDISGKQDVITDLATIRAGASKGATALQSIPAEYITETELSAKGYVTTTKLLEQMTNKLDINASNLDVAGKSLISGLGMPSYRYVELTLGASGTIYTAPANGYFYVYGRARIAQSNLMYVYCDDNGNEIPSGRVLWCSASGGNGLWDTFPIQKGKKVVIAYNINVEKFRFIYAEGSKED